MIRLIDIRLNAAHPELPLAEAVTYTGAPSTMLIRGVPGNCGKWCITSVYVAATFPDGSTSTRLAVQSANGVWVATLPATNTSGRTANGLRIMADGEDENGELVTGYILGVADFAVASLGVTPAPEPGATSWQMLYFDTVPGVLRKGDVTKIDGVMKLYNGTAWEPFAAPVTFDNTVTPSSANGVKSSGIWSALWGALIALPTGFTSLYDWCVAQLAGKQPTLSAQQLANIAAVPGKLAKSGDKMSGPLTMDKSVIELKDSTGYKCVLRCTGTGGDFYIDFYDSQGTLLSSLFVPASNGSLALTAGSGHGGNLAALDSSGNPTDSQIPAANVALKGNIPYNLGDPIVIGSGLVLTDNTDPNNPINYAEVTPLDRTANFISIAVDIDELRITLPTKAISGKVRDFGLTVDVASGVTPPAISIPGASAIGNSDGTMPELTEGVNLLYFSEIGPYGMFLVKGEKLQLITQ